MRGLKRSPGFTLVELLVVILIIAALMVIALPRYFHAVYMSRVRGCQAQIKVIDTATQAFYARNHVWPATIEELARTTAPAWVVAPPLDDVPPCPFGVAYRLVPELEDGTRGTPTPDNPQVGVGVAVEDHFEGSWINTVRHRD